MQWILQNQKICSVKESKGKLSVIFTDISSINQAVGFLKAIAEKVNG
jgi:hypothetical protein